MPGEETWTPDQVRGDKSLLQAPESVIPRLFVCHHGLFVCHPGLDPGSMALNWRLQWASLTHGSRVFARDDKKEAALTCHFIESNP